MQNEPLNPDNNPSLSMTALEQAEFIKRHLGPAFRKAGLATKIICYDHNADRPDYPLTILNDPEAKAFVEGYIRANRSGGPEPNQLTRIVLDRKPQPVPVGHPARRRGRHVRLVTQRAASLGRIRLTPGQQFRVTRTTGFGPRKES